MLPQFSLPDKRARIEKCILQAYGLPERDVKKGVPEIGPLGLVLTAKRRMIGIGRGDDQQIGIRETWDEYP